MGRILGTLAVVWVLWPAGFAHAECPLGSGLPAFATGSASAPAAVSHSTLLGGECDDESLGIAQDGAGNVYVAGVVKSSVPRAGSTRLRGTRINLVVGRR